MNQDGIISGPEQAVAILPLGQPAPVRYNYDYLSYSTGINYRVSKELAIFGRYSRGGRATGDSILFTPTVSTTTGQLTNKAASYDPVRQAEIGLKLRRRHLDLNVTGFWATTRERNMQVSSSGNGVFLLNEVLRTYRAMGVEVEGNITHGIFNLGFNGTYTMRRSAAIRTMPRLSETFLVASPS